MTLMMKLFVDDISGLDIDMRSFSASRKIEILAKELGCSYDEVAIEKGSHGKPYLNDCPMHFNITHTGSLWLMITSDMPVGIDAEYHKPRKTMGDILKTYFHDDEYRAYNGLVADQEKTCFFYDIWTKKEAYAKYTGLGMAYDFAQDSFESTKLNDAYIYTKQYYATDREYPVTLSICRGENFSFEDIIFCGDIGNLGVP